MSLLIKKYIYINKLKIKNFKFYYLKKNEKMGFGSGYNPTLKKGCPTSLPRGGGGSSPLLWARGGCVPPQLHLGWLEGHHHRAGG
jgi:hypothetical protein